MAKKKTKPKKKAAEQVQRPKDFLDMQPVSHGDGAEKLPAHDG